MLSQEEQDSLSKAERIYERDLKVALEAAHMDEYVVIEPVSGDHFLGRTIGEATAQARTAHPGRLKHLMRVGHSAAYHIGATS